MQKLHFGPAGVPLSCKERSSLAGVLCTAELGLDAMELEFVRGVRLKEEDARKLGVIAREKGVVLTAHAPYFINLLSTDKSKREKSIERIVKSAKVLEAAGGYSVVFHPAYYGSLTSEEALKEIKKEFEKLFDALNASGVRKVWIRPETMGKLSQFGSFNELLELCSEFGKCLPCIDFAHLYARTLGRINNKEEWRKLLEAYEATFGSKALKEMHIHISGMEYGEKGERRHLNLEESGLKWRELLEVLKEFDVAGVVISESPNIEQDALLMKKYWESL